MSFDVGCRVETASYGKGTVAFFGLTKFSDGEWVGIILDEPRGKNNGTVKEVEYFSCEQNYGLFVKPGQVFKEGELPKSELKSTIGSRKPSMVDFSAASRMNREASTLSQSSGTSKGSGIARKSIAPPSSITEPKRKPSVPVMTTGKSSSRSISFTKMQPPASTTKIAAKTPLTKGPSPPTSGRASMTPTPPTVSKQATPEPPVVVEQNVEEKEEIVLPPPDLTESVLSRAKKIDQQPSAAAFPDTPKIVGSSDQSQELEYLRLQVKELTDKLENLRAKRKEDHAKLLEFDRQKIEMLSLQETKSRLADLNNELQRKLHEEKIAREEVQKWKDENIEMLHDHGQKLETYLMDKEIAEETSEMLKVEMETYKDKCDALSEQLSILSKQLESGGEGIPAGNIIQMKQIEHQNNRLKEALIKLRDENGIAVSLKNQAVERAEKLMMENTSLVKIVEELRKETELAEAKIASHEEQLSNAACSEKIIEALTTKNLELEDSIALLEQKLEELEQSRDIDEQLIEEQSLNEKESLVKIQKLEIEIGELNQRIKDEKKHASFLSDTILKFKTLVGKRNEEIQDYKDEILGLKETLNGRASDDVDVASMATKLEMTAGKVFAESVERQLALVEVDYARKHSNYLKAFLPDNFSKPGGDNDSVSLCVLFPRLAAKVILFSRLAHEKYPEVPGGMRREHVTRSYKGEQWSLVIRVDAICTHLYAILRQFDSALNTISIEQLSLLTQSLADMVIYEKGVENLMELLKQGRFDENTSLDALIKAFIYFQNLQSVHLNSDSFDAVQWLGDTLDHCSAQLASIKLNARRIAFLANEDEPRGDVGDMLDLINTEVAAAETAVIRSKKSVPTTTKLKLNTDFIEDVSTVVNQLERVSRALQETATTASTNISMNPEINGFSVGSLREMLNAVIVKIFGPTAVEKSVEPPKKCITTARATAEKILVTLDGKTLEQPKEENRPFPAILERAHTRKQAASEADGLRWQIEKKENEMSELKKAVRARVLDLSNVKTRLEMAEARLQSSQEKGSDQAQLLQTQVDMMTADQKKKQIEFDETVQSLELSIKNLEAQNNQLKERASNMGKQAMIKNILDAQPTTSVISPTTKSSDAETAYLVQKLTDANADRKRLNLEVRKLRAEDAARNLRGVKHVAGLISGPLTLRNQTRDDELDKYITKLHNEYTKVSWQIIKDHPISHLYTGNSAEDHKNEQKRNELLDRESSCLSKLKRAWRDRWNEEYPFEKEKIHIENVEEFKKNTFAKWGVSWLLEPLQVA